MMMPWLTQYAMYLLAQWVAASLNVEPAGALSATALVRCHATR
jgi:hypothetical protein